MMRLVLICLTVMVCALCGAATALLMAGKPITDLLTVVGVVAMPAIVALVGYLTANVSQVKANTNGRITDMHNSLMEMARTLAASPALSPAVIQAVQKPPPAEAVDAARGGES